MSAPLFIDTAAVAGMLGQSAEHFLRIRADLEDDHGFPMPMPHWKRPLKWRRDQVEGWLASQGLPRPDLPAIPMGANVIRMIDFARQA